VAWEPLGWKPAWLSQFDPDHKGRGPDFASAVLAHRFPHVENRGDMTRFEEWPDGHIDLLVGGTPCQSFSVAGLRRGLDDPRGSLMLVYGAIARRYRPRWVVWENVPGVLSADNGRAFGTFLGMLALIGYGFAYRVLDAQYFALAQRRARVFVVGYLGDWRPPAAVLFERESLSRHPAPRRETGEGTAPSTAPSLTASGRGVERVGESRGQDPVVAYALTAKGGSGRIDGESETFIPMTATTLRARDQAKGVDSDCAPLLKGAGRRLRWI
jgi:DNA (cytosine-5)-methyltransferase 1